MLRARWIVPLILVVPLAAPAPATEVVEGRAYVPGDEPRVPEALPTGLRPFDDGISHARSRVIPSEDPAPPAPIDREWSYGPAHDATPALESTSVERAVATPDAEPVGEAPPAPTPPGDEGAAPPSAPDVEEPTAPAEPADPPGADEPDAPREQDADAPRMCTGLCFEVELGLL